MILILLLVLTVSSVFHFLLKQHIGIFHWSILLILFFPGITLSSLSLTAIQDKRTKEQTRSTSTVYSQPTCARCSLLLLQVSSSLVYLAFSQEEKHLKFITWVALPYDFWWGFGNKEPSGDVRVEEERLHRLMLLWPHPLWLVRLQWLCLTIKATAPIWCLL